jgi:D-amino-acid dehydrogenase
VTRAQAFQPTEGRVVVVGGGIVGLSCAWFLRAAGADVMLLERGGPGGGASRGNAGAICPSMVEPLPAPGMIRHALANLLRPDAALHVRPSALPGMARWLVRFALAARAAPYERGLSGIAQLGRGAVDAYDELAAAGIGTHARRDGYLYVFGSVEEAREDRAHVARLSALGLCATPEPLMDGDGARELEPLLSQAVRAAFVVPRERWIDPSRLVDELVEAIRSAGVEVIERVRATDVREIGGGVSVATDRGTFDGALAVVASGVWTKELSARAGLPLPLRPGKGYSFAIRPASIPGHLLYLDDAHVIATPMGDRLRIAGTMEFDGTTDRFNPRRIEAIVRALRPYVLDVDWTARTDEWVGPRPMTPDGLPIVGPLPGSSRIVVAAGHNMLGVTLGPVTGRTVARLVTSGDAGIDLAPFSPRRFAGRR